MKHITKRQHFVTESYLKFWLETGKRYLYLYDLPNKQCKKSTPKEILTQKYFYEHDMAKPDNEVENVLSLIDGEFAALLRDMNKIISKYRFSSEEKTLRTELKALITLKNQIILKKFSAYQYLRIPGAMEQKRYELEPGKIHQLYLEEQLKPANFVRSGYEYIRERFLNHLGIIIFYSLDEELLTSDWPCFDFNCLDYSPILGEEIGLSKDVIIAFPLLPRVLMILYPYHAITGQQNKEHIEFGVFPKNKVKNTNKLIIQQASRWIISNKKCDFIFNIASKRKEK